MNVFFVDADRCLGDGLCIEACSRGVLRDNGQGIPLFVEEKAHLCNECGHCAAVCPVHAIVPPGGEEEETKALDRTLDINFAQASQFILSCRSIRQFKEPTVGEKEITELLHVARKAPSGSNAQPVRWKVVNGREKMRRISALTMEWFDTVVRYDPILTKRYNVDSMMSRYNGGYDIIMRGAPNAVFAITDRSARWGAVDSSIALTYFCLAAHGKHIASCWCGFGMSAVLAYAPLREYMGLGEDDIVQGIVFFGYPAIRYHAMPPRKPLRVEWL